jgi:hypothetical protein
MKMSIFRKYESDVANKLSLHSSLPTLCPIPVPNTAPEKHAVLA